MISQKRLKALLDYNPDTGVFVWVSTRRGTDRKVAGYKDTDSYWCITVEGIKYGAHRLAYLYMEGYIPPVGCIDHDDRVRDNNTWANLILVDGFSAQNRNKALHTSNTSGHVGVWQTVYGTWRAAIGNGNKEYLGTFKTKEEAIDARTVAEAKYKYHPKHGGSG